MSEPREMTPEEREIYHVIYGPPRRVVDPEREPDNPDLWMPDWKPKGDTAPGPIPPTKEDTNA